jgi:hypothetical protein
MTAERIITVTIDRALKMLDACGAQYKVILSDGTEYGTLEVVDPKPQRHRRTRGDRPYGALGAHVKPYLQHNTKPGDVLSIPFGEFEPSHVRGAVAAYLSSMWGRGTYTTATAPNAVEVLRLQ